MKIKILIIIIFISINCFSQIKIDNVTIPDSIFIQYVRYCENNPDKVINKYEVTCDCLDSINYFSWGHWAQNSNDRLLEREEKFRLDIIKIRDFTECINGIQYHIYLIPHEMTGEDFLKWYSDYLTKKHKL